MTLRSSPRWRPLPSGSKGMTSGRWQRTVTRLAAAVPLALVPMPGGGQGVVEIDDRIACPR